MMSTVPPGKIESTNFKSTSTPIDSPKIMKCSYNTTVPICFYVITLAYSAPDGDL